MKYLIILLFTYCIGNLTYGQPYHPEVDQEEIVLLEQMTGIATVMGNHYTLIYLKLIWVLFPRKTLRVRGTLDQYKHYLIPMKGLSMVI